MGDSAEEVGSQLFRDVLQEEEGQEEDSNSSREEGSKALGECASAISEAG